MPSGSPASGLRERKSRRARAAVVRAAAELTLEEGFAAATIARIAERAEVAPRTIFTWFPSKEDILLGGSAPRLERGVRHLRGGTGDLADRIGSWMNAEAVHESPEGDDGLMLLVLRAISFDPDLRAREAQLFAPIREVFAEVAAVDLGVDPTDERAQIVASAAMATLDGLRARAVEQAGAGRHGGAGLVLRFLRAGTQGLREAGGPADGPEQAPDAGPPASA